MHWWLSKSFKFNILTTSQLIWKLPQLFTCKMSELLFNTICSNNWTLNLTERRLKDFTIFSPHLHSRCPSIWSLIYLFCSETLTLYHTIIVEELLLLDSISRNLISINHLISLDNELVTSVRTSILQDTILWSKRGRELSALINALVLVLIDHTHLVARAYSLNKLHL